MAMWLFLATSFRVRAQPGKSPLFDPRGYLATSSEVSHALLPPELAQAGGGDAAFYASHGGDDGEGYEAVREEEDTGASRAAVLATVAAQARRERDQGGPAGEDRHLIVDAGGGCVILAERLPPATGPAGSTNSTPAAYM